MYSEPVCRDGFYTVWMVSIMFRWFQYFTAGSNIFWIVWMPMLMPAWKAGEDWLHHKSWQMMMLLSHCWRPTCWQGWRPHNNAFVIEWAPLMRFRYPYPNQGYMQPPQIIISVLRTFWNISKHNTHPSNWHTVYFFTKAHTDVKMFVLWTNFSRLNLSTNSVRKFVGNFLPNLKVSLTNLLIYQTGYIVSETIPAKTNLWKISYNSRERGECL